MPESDLLFGVPGTEEAQNAIERWLASMTPAQQVAAMALWVAAGNGEYEGDEDLYVPINGIYSSASVDFLNARVEGDASDRFSISADGDHWWGDGTGSQDIKLYRAAANDLRTDDIFSSVVDIYARVGAATQAIIGAVGGSGEAGLRLGIAGDARLYRISAGLIGTDGTLVAGTGLTVVANGITVSSGAVALAASYAVNADYLADRANTGAYVNTQAADSVIIQGRTAGIVPLKVNAPSGHTGELARFDVNNSPKVSIDANGLHTWIAGNEQTTVGSAGGASALPATPTKYLKIKDSAGTTLIVPAYAAA